MGRRPSTPDSLPVISSSPKLVNVWYGFGHGHMGLSWGPTTGRMISDMMTKRSSNTNPAAFQIDRQM
jgi:D-amino-acid dehydrogenase